VSNQGALYNLQGATLTTQGFTNAAAATFMNAGTLTASAGGTFTNSGTISSQGAFNNYGTLNSNVGAGITNGGSLTVYAGGSLTNAGSLTNSFGATLSNSGSMSNISGGTWTNAGALNNNTGATLTNYSGATLANSGALSNAGTLANSGTLTNRTGGSLSNSGTLNNSAGGSLSIATGATLTNGSQLYNAGTLTNAGILTNYGAITGTGSYVQTAGQTVNNGGITQASLSIQGGVLTGTGPVTGNLSVQNGASLIAPYIGVLGVTGNYTNAGTLAVSLVNLAGGAGNSYSQVQVTNGAANISGGTLQISLVPGALVNAGDTFDVLHAPGGLTGTFASITGVPSGFTETYTSTDVYLVATQSVLTPIQLPSVNNGSLTLAPFLQYSLGSQYLTNNGTLEISPGATLSDTQSYGIGNTGSLVNYGTLTNPGTLTNSAGTLTNYGTFANSGGFNNVAGFVNSGPLTNNAGALISNTGSLTSAGVINNHSIINNYGQLVNNSVNGGLGALTNYGVLNNNSGGTLTNTGVLVNRADYGPGTLNNSGLLVNNAGSGYYLANMYGGALNNNSGGTLVNLGQIYNCLTGTITNSGTLINLGTITENGYGGGSYVQTAGRTVNNGTIQQTTVSIQGGILEGTGSISGNLSVAAGAVAHPGLGYGTAYQVPGVLSVGGNYTGPGSTLAVSILNLAGGAGAGYSSLSMGGVADITGGTLEIRLASGAQVTAGQQFDVLHAAGGLTGTFTNATGAASYFTESYTGTDLLLTAASSISVDALPAGTNNGAMLVQSSLSNTSPLYNAGEIHVFGSFTNQMGAAITNNAGATLTVYPGGNLDIEYSTVTNNAGATLNNSGLLFINRSDANNPNAVLTNAGVLNNYASGQGLDNEYGTVNNSGTLNNYAGAWLLNHGQGNSSAPFNNSGTLNNYSAGNWQGPTDLAGSRYGILNSAGTLSNSGTLNNYSGATIGNSGGTLSNSGTLNNYAGSTIESDSLDLVHTQNGSTLHSTYTGTITNSGTFINNGTITGTTSVTINSNSAAGTTDTNTVSPGSYVQTAGLTVNNGIITQTLVDIQGGTLQGTGTINGALNVAAGATLHPGNSPGVMTVNGTYTNAGTLAMAILNLTQGPGTGYSRLVVNSSIVTILGGTLQIDLMTGAFLTTGDRFDILHASGGLSGAFGQVTGDSSYFTLDYEANDVFLVADQNVTPTPVPPGLFLLAPGLVCLYCMRKRIGRGARSSLN